MRQTDVFQHAWRQVSQLSLLAPGPEILRRYFNNQNYPVGQ